MNDKHKETISELNSLIEIYDLELLDELVSIFASQKESLIHDWRNRQNFPENELSQIAHKIKSSARNVGAKKIGSILEEVEKKPNKDTSRATIDEIESEFDFFIKTFQNWKVGRK